MSQPPAYDKKTKMIINRPLAWTSLNLSKEAKSLVFDVDEEGNLKAIPVILVDPTLAFPATGTTARITDGLGSGTPATVCTPQLSALFTGGALLCNAVDYVWNTLTIQEEMVRTPVIFKTLLSATAAGSTAVWTPAGGKRFRLMGGSISLSKDAACAGAESIALLDNVTTIAAWTISLGALVAIGAVTIIPFMFTQNGYLSTAINQTLNVSLNGALTAGNCSVSVWGTEE